MTELLVVIAIIAVLAAILFPVFAHAKENGKRVDCIAKLGQLGTGMQLYAHDFDDGLPQWVQMTPTDVVRTPDGIPVSWDIALAPYVRSAHAFMCPTDSAPRRDIPGRGSKLYRSYAMTANVQGLSQSRVPAPAASVVVLETLTFFPNVDQWEMDGLLGVLNKQTLLPQDDIVAEKPAFRHHDSGNYLFLDGHVKSLRGPKPAFPGYKTNAEGLALCGDGDPLPQ